MTGKPRLSKISTKAEFLAMSRLALLGNAPRYWDSPEAAMADGIRGQVAIRNRARNSPFMKCDVPIEDARRAIESMIRSGADPSSFYVNEQTDDASRTLQGEVWRAPGGLYLNYSTMPAFLRVALDRDGHHVQGVAAVAILRAYLCPQSYDDVADLLDAYDDAVIEFTAYRGAIGTLPNRNTLIWEVRNY